MSLAGQNLLQPHHPEYAAIREGRSGLNAALRKGDVGEVRTGKTFFIAWLTAACFLLAGHPAAYAQTQASASDVKAAFLYNFTKFIDWPPQAFAGANSPFFICIAGDPFDGALERLVQGEVLDGRPLMVRHIKMREEVRGCQILYVPQDQAGFDAEMINAAGKEPVLTVGESASFINEGGMMRFVNSAGRIRFEINPDAAQRASLKISSRLLRLAEIVRPSRRSGAFQ